MKKLGDRQSTPEQMLNTPLEKIISKLEAAYLKEQQGVVSSIRTSIDQLLSFVDVQLEEVCPKQTYENLQELSENKLRLKNVLAFVEDLQEKAFPSATSDAEYVSFSKSEVAKRTAIEDCKSKVLSLYEKFENLTMEAGDSPDGKQLQNLGNQFQKIIKYLDKKVPQLFGVEVPMDLKIEEKKEFVLEKIEEALCAFDQLLLDRQIQQNERFEKKQQDLRAQIKLSIQGVYEKTVDENTVVPEFLDEARAIKLDALIQSIGAKYGVLFCESVFDYVREAENPEILDDEDVEHRMKGIKQTMNTGTWQEFCERFDLDEVMQLTLCTQWKNYEYTDYTKKEMSLLHGVRSKRNLRKKLKLDAQENAMDYFMRFFRSHYSEDALILLEQQSIDTAEEHSTEQMIVEEQNPLKKVGDFIERLLGKYLAWKHGMYK